MPALGLCFLDIVFSVIFARTRLFPIVDDGSPFSVSLRTQLSISFGDFSVVLTTENRPILVIDNNNIDKKRPYSSAVSFQILPSF